MKKHNKRIAIMVGAGFVPGLNAVVKGAAMAAGQLGWEVVGIRDGFEGLLNPENYPEGGLLPLTPSLIENIDPTSGSVLGQSGRVDPFNVRQLDEYEMIEEVDRSDELLERLKAEKIDALIAVVGGQGLSILYRLQGKGLKVVCIPRAIENDVAATLVSFGFNSALNFTIDMLDKARQAAMAARKIAVVEVLGSDAGWLALQAGIAADADAVLIPEIPCDLSKVATKLKQVMTPRRRYGLVVVAQGAELVNKAKAKGGEEPVNTLKASLSPLATGDHSSHVIQRDGQAAKAVANGLQLLIAEETYPLLLGSWSRVGKPTAVDRQLGIAYGVGAIEALNSGKNGVMVAFEPPDIEFVPLEDAINRVRKLPASSLYLKIAESLGICLGN